MADNTLNATLRTEFGKGAARRTRRAGLVPAVLYGHGSDPVHLSLPGHETFLIIRHSRNAVIELSFDGKSELALVKDVQINHLIRELEHIDLVIVRRDEKVTVDVPVHLVGEPVAGAVAALEAQTISVLAPAISIPESIVVSIEGLEDGAIVTIKDIELPAGVTTEVDGDQAVVVVSIPRAVESADDAAEGVVSELAAGDDTE
ncbi:MAG: 50S ribosomal protein L25/general stress protein Ctc [Ruaniaceae bacterium]|nr:50S ribosomal protein L25/general stress protein Ctc [Ruaniaceae bacterium]